MNSTLEKLFFAYILKNKKHFEHIEANFFKNKEIQFVYDVLKDYLKGGNTAVPSNKQILEMVRLRDEDELITPAILKAMLSVELSEYDEENFIVKHFNAWVMMNRVNNGIIEIMEQGRAIGDVDINSIMRSTEEISKIVKEMSRTDFINEDDLGSDFDDVKSHAQNNAVNKIRTGFKCLDELYGGGFDRGTLNMLMAETNNGKSLWMQNIAVNCADLGYNVLYITLEMSERKILKRTGSMRLRIPIYEYDVLSNDALYLSKKMNEHDAKFNDGIVEKKKGKLITKFWAAGTSTVSDFDLFIQKYKEKKGLSFDLIIVDYLTKITVSKTSKNDTLYTKGEFLADGLRALAAKFDFSVLTATQVDKKAWGANDINLESVPESKAIAETSDTFCAIIRTPEMKKENKYWFKKIKDRDGDCNMGMVELNLNTKYLTLENDRFLEK